MLTFYDAFSGIGGFHLGITQAHPDWKCVGAAEIDKHCQKKYKEKFPEVSIDGNIREVDKLPAGTDILCGGFPCQSFSLAGKRRGFEDTRGTLIFEVLRLAAASKPKLLFLENVKGLTSHDKGRTLGTILYSLGELGYWWEYEVLNSENFTLAQSRERIFIIGHLGGKSQQPVFPLGKDDKTIALKKPKERMEQTAYSLKARDYANWNRNFVVGHSRDKTGKEATYHLKERVGSLKGRSGNQEDYILQIPEVAPTLTAGGHSGGLHSDMLVIPVLTPDRAEKRQNGRRFKTQGEARFTLTAQDKHGIYDGQKIRRLTPLEWERLQGFPDNWTAGQSDSQRYKQLGNAVSVPVVKAIAERITETAVKPIPPTDKSVGILGVIL